MRLVAQLGIDTFYIVVVHKIIQLQSFWPVAAHFIEAFYGMSDLKVVVIIVSGIQCLVQMIVGNGMKGSFVDPADVIAVDDLTHQPEFRFYFIGSLTQCLHKIKIQHIGSVQTDTVNIEFVYPETDHIADIVLNFRIALVQFYQKIVTAPVLIRESIVVFIVATEVHIAVPVTVAGVLPVGLNIFKCKKVTAGVIEYTVQNNTDALLMTFLYKMSQIFICAKTAVQFLVVCGFITMSYGFK